MFDIVRFCLFKQKEKIKVKGQYCRYWCENNILKLLYFMFITIILNVFYNTTQENFTKLLNREILFCAHSSPTVGIDCVDVGSIKFLVQEIIFL